MRATPILPLLPIAGPRSEGRSVIANDYTTTIVAEQDFRCRAIRLSNAIPNRWMAAVTSVA